MNDSLKYFVSRIQSKQKQEDTKSLIKFMEEASGFEATLNGKIIGYGLYGFKYKNGKECNLLFLGT